MNLCPPSTSGPTQSIYKPNPKRTLIRNMNSLKLKVNPRKDVMTTTVRVDSSSSLFIIVFRKTRLSSINAGNQLKTLATSLPIKHLL